MFEVRFCRIRAFKDGARTRKALRNRLYLLLAVGESDQLAPPRACDGAQHDVACIGGLGPAATPTYGSDASLLGTARSVKAYRLL